MKLAFWASLFGFTFTLGANAACEKVGSYAPAGDDTYAVKCNGEILKGEEILPGPVADKIIQERNEASEREKRDFHEWRAEQAKLGIHISPSGAQRYPEQEREESEWPQAPFSQ